MISRILDPKNDFAFKKVFGTEKNKGILISFLNDMIDFGEKHPIVDVQFVKPNLNPEIISQKVSIVDVLCKDQKGQQFIVEMQIAPQKGFDKRAQFYAAKVYGAQARVGSEYQHLKAVVFLAIADFVIFPDKQAYKSDHVILDKKTHEQDLKDFSFTFLELPKFNKTIDQLETAVEKWAYFFKHADEVHWKDIPKLTADQHSIEQAYQELDIASFNEEELISYEAVQKIDNDHKAILAYQFDKGKTEGREEGKAEGREEGEAIGLEKGKAEGELLAKLAIAKHLLDSKMEWEFISSVTSLPIDTLKELLHQNR